MPNSTLDAIRTKVRRITRSPTTTQLTTADLDEYINTMLVFDLPQEVKLFDLRTNIFFFTEPNQELYTEARLPTQQQLTFNDAYVSIHQPIYADGERIGFSQSRSDFYYWFSRQYTVRDTGLRGDGVTTNFNGQISNVNNRDNAILLPNNVSLTSVDGNGDGIVAYDNGNGGLIGDVALLGPGAINYQTGNFQVNFNIAPAQGEIIYAHYKVEETGKPRMLLFFENRVRLRPIPDKSYKIEMEAMRRPTDLLGGLQTPELEQWWQYIAFGAAKKIFEDRMDMESAAMLQPELDRQQRYALRSTLQQTKQQRARTIYAVDDTRFNHDTF